MTKSNSNSQQTDQVWSAARNFDLSKMMTSGEGGVKAMAEAQEHLITRIATMNREIAEFVDRRLKHDRETVHALAACKSPQEAMSIWGAFVETASRHYAEEFGTIAGLSVDHAREAVEDIQHEVEETVKPLAGGRTDA